MLQAAGPSGLAPWVGGRDNSLHFPGLHQVVMDISARKRVRQPLTMCGVFVDLGAPLNVTAEMVSSRRETPIGTHA